MLETDRLPSAFVRACNRVDRIWVPTSFNEQSFLASGVEAHRLEVVAPGVLVPADPAAVEPFPLPPAQLTFLSVFAWGWRKGWDVLVEAYVRAFRRDDETLLVIRSSLPEPGGPSIDARIDAFLGTLNTSRASAPRILVIDETLRAHDLAALYAAADAFVLPSRGEGLGLPYLEAMAAGLPVIATAWSGQLDFLDEHNALLVDIEGLRPAGETPGGAGHNYDPSHRWAAPSVEHTMQRMREVADDLPTAAVIGRRGRETVLDAWTIDHAADRCLAALQRVLAAPPDRPRRRMQRRASVLWSGEIHGVSGPAAEARALLTQLDHLTPVAAHHLGRSRVAALLDADEATRLERMSDRRVADRYVRILQGPWWALRRDPDARATIGRVTELPHAIPADVATRMAELEEVWVPSTRAGAVVVAAGVDPDRVVVVPTPISDRFRKGAGPEPSAARRRLIRSTGSWDGASGWDVLVRAFTQEFAREPVDLELRVTARMPVADVERCVGHLVSSLPTGSRVGGRIRVNSDVFDDRALARWYRGASIVVDCSRRDGLGRAALEAAGLAVPVVCSDLVSRSELLTPPGVHIVAFQSGPRHDARQAGATGLGEWADPDMGALREGLRSIVDGPAAAGEQADCAAAAVAATLSARSVAGLVADRLRVLVGRPV